MADKGKRLIFSGGMTLAATESNAGTATILPGMSVIHTATTLTDNTNASTVFGYPHLFADYDMLAGKTVDDLWAVGENLIARELTQGCTANLIVAAGNNITARGVALTSNGAGKLKIAATDDTDYVLCYSDEIINAVADSLVRVKGA
tara:strand:+ start:9917 stop:10357 length:441 start_codon:yes stop_codon:yes gene_type:complete